MKNYNCAIACLVTDENKIPQIINMYTEQFLDVYILLDSEFQANDKNEKVYVRKFDNFQEQRNFLINKIDDEKVLFIDEDEVLIIEDEKIFENSLNSISNDQVMFFRYKEETTNEVGTTNVRGILKQHKYTGFVHENIYQENIKYVEIRGAFLMHNGYSENQKKKKAYRNLRLLFKDENRTSRFCYYYLKECVTYDCEYNYELLPKVEPENYYMEFLELLVLRLPESKEKSRYIQSLNKNQIINTLIYLKYGTGSPEKKYEDYFRRRNYGACVY